MPKHSVEDKNYDVYIVRCVEFVLLDRLYRGVACWTLELLLRRIHTLDVCI